MENEERASKGISRRAFLGGAVAVSATAALGIAGCSATKGGAAAGTEVAASGNMQTTDPSKALWPVVEEFDPKAAGEGVVAFIA